MGTLDTVRSEERGHRRREQGLGRGPSRSQSRGGSVHGIKGPGVGGGATELKAENGIEGTAWATAFTGASMGKTVGQGG